MKRTRGGGYTPEVDLSRTGLPLVPYLDEIASLLSRHRGLVLTAEPGSGKSTLVPPFLLDAPWLGGAKIVMLEPRRLAAAAVASRIAELLEEPLGRRAGYRVRSASCVSRETMIEVVTEGLLTRAIQEDQLLQGVGLVIFDEFHERSLHADLALALALEVRRARPGLAVLVMSATLEAGPVSALLGGAPILTCPGRPYPVTTSYRPLPGRGRGEEEAAVGVERLFGETEGDLLVFLPGVGEISRVRERLEGLLGGRARLLILHGSLPLEEQRRVIRPETQGREEAPTPRRIILSTSIAETSLTVPGVRVVADSGWARISRFHPATGMDRLVTERVSVSSADQRAGRAGRLGPGVCARFWSKTEPLLPHLEPEILRSDLAGLVLECALWGAREPSNLSWLDPPPQSSWNLAAETLRMLGLLADSGPTDRGRKVAALGLSPRLGMLALEGAESGEVGLASMCAAVLSERDGSEIQDDPDLRLRLEMIRTGRGGRASWRAAVERESRRILRRLRTGTGAPAWTEAREGSVGSLLSRAFPDRIARREADGSYRFVTGRAALFPSRGRPGAARVPSPSRAAVEWIVAPDTDAGESVGVIRLAAPLGREEAERALAPIVEQREDVRWDGLAPKGYLVKTAGRLVLAERSMKASAQSVAESFHTLLLEKGTRILPWDEAARSLLGRMRFYAAHGEKRGEIEPADILTDAGLARESAGWLAPHLVLSGGPVLTSKGLTRALAGILGKARGDFQKSVPESIVLPTGGRRRIDYGAEADAGMFEAAEPPRAVAPAQGQGGPRPGAGPRRLGTNAALDAPAPAQGQGRPGQGAGRDAPAPAVEARIQEVFGLLQSPFVCGVPLTFRLLSPAHRPVQITRDLASFWKSGYAEVRKEMRGRYPKHYWPEDPMHAEPISGVRPKRKKDG